MPRYAGLIWSQDTSGRLFSINTATGAATDIGVSGTTAGTVGLAESPTAGVLFGSTPFALIQIQANGSGFTGPVGSQPIEGLAYDASSSLLYGALNGDFFTVNQVTGAIATSLASTPNNDDIEGLAVGNGVVYALSSTNDSLFSYTPGTNTWTLIGATGFDFDDPGLAYNPSLNLLYAIGAGDALYTINPGTGAATLVGALGVTGQFEGGLAFIDDGNGVPEPATVGFVALGLAAAYFRRKA